MRVCAKKKVAIPQSIIASSNSFVIIILSSAMSIYSNVVVKNFLLYWISYLDEVLVQLPPGLHVADHDLIAKVEL